MDNEIFVKFKEWLSNNMNMAIDANMVMALVENIIEKDRQIANLKERLEAWRYNNIAWDCLAEVSENYYTNGGIEFCGICHNNRNDHSPTCIVNAATKQLQKLKDLGEI